MSKQEAEPKTWQPGYTVMLGALVVFIIFLLVLNKIYN